MCALKKCHYNQYEINEVGQGIHKGFCPNLDNLFQDCMALVVLSI